MKNRRNWQLLIEHIVLRVRRQGGQVSKIVFVTSMTRASRREDRHSANDCG